MKNWEGYRFGKLIVLKFHERKRSGKEGRSSSYNWLCKCDCGKETIVNISSLIRKYTKSCGCEKTTKFVKLMKTGYNRIKEGEAAFNGIILIYKQQAKNRNLIFNLTDELCRKLFKTNCFYCDKIPSNIKKGRTSNYIYSGIDRVDNSIGYTEDNCVSCCKSCNFAKSSITKEMIIKAYEFFAE